MPQLMPLYWILSSIMIMLFFILMLKVYGNFFFYFVESEMSSKSYNMNLWYW